MELHFAMLREGTKLRWGNLPPVFQLHGASHVLSTLESINVELSGPILLLVVSLYVTILSSWKLPGMPEDDQYYHSKISQSTATWSLTKLPGDLSLAIPYGDSLLQKSVVSVLSKDQDEEQEGRANVVLMLEDVMILVEA